MKDGARGTDTEYVAAADSEGNLVSFIQSNFMGFGSGIVEPETGIVLQNRGHLFSLDENHPNCIGPHKRCVHTLMPGMILKDGKPFAALGLKGGHVQPQVQVQIITNLIDFGMTVQESIAAPRFNHIEGLKVGLEPAYPRSHSAGTKAPRPPGCLRQSRILRRRSRYHDSSRIRRLHGRLGPAQRRLRHRLLSAYRASLVSDSGFQVSSPKSKHRIQLRFEVCRLMSAPEISSPFDGGRLRWG